MTAEERLIEILSEFPTSVAISDSNQLITTGKIKDKFNVYLIGELAAAILKEFVPVVGSICSRHKEPDPDCELCKVHLSFDIDTKKYCESGGYIHKDEIGVDKEKMKEIISNWVEKNRDYMMSTGTWSESLAHTLESKTEEIIIKKGCNDGQ